MSDGTDNPPPANPSGRVVLTADLAQIGLEELKDHWGWFLTPGLHPARRNDP